MYFFQDKARVEISPDPKGLPCLLPVCLVCGWFGHNQGNLKLPLLHSLNCPSSLSTIALIISSMFSSMFPPMLPVYFNIPCGFLVLTLSNPFELLQPFPWFHAPSPLKNSVILVSNLDLRPELQNHKATFRMSQCCHILFIYISISKAELICSSFSLLTKMPISFP